MRLKRKVVIQGNCMLFFGFFTVAVSCFENFTEENKSLELDERRNKK